MSVLINYVVTYDLGSNVTEMYKETPTNTLRFKVPGPGSVSWSQNQSISGPGGLRRPNIDDADLFSLFGDYGEPRWANLS